MLFFLIWKTNLQNLIGSSKKKKKKKITVLGGSPERSYANAYGVVDDALTGFHSGWCSSDRTITDPHRGGLTSHSSLKTGPPLSCCHPAGQGFYAACRTTVFFFSFFNIWGRVTLYTIHQFAPRAGGRDAISSSHSSAY